MQVKDMMTKKVIVCDENEPVSQALGKMRENNIHQLLVMKGKELKGLVFLNDIVRKEADLSSIKVASLTKSIPSIASNKTLEEATEIILKSNSRALPVVDKDIVGIISETDIMKNVDIEFDVDALAKKCFFVEDTDKIGKVRNLIAQKNISRIPVVKGGRLLGVIGTLELANLMEQGKTSKESRGWGLKGKSYKEKMNFDSIPVTTVMKEVSFLRKPTKADKVIDVLTSDEQVFIVNGQVDIITPKDVLRLLLKPKKTTYFQISGLEDEDSMTVAKLHSIIEKTIKPISKVTEIQPLHMFIEHHQKLGGKTKYSIRAQLPTQIGTFVVTKVWGYNILTAMQEAMNNLDKEFWKKHEKLRSKDRDSKRATRGK
ncbi:MAG: CBS domain-containing protein [Candidatus Aenigmarchaeota archaeon]|nr:CBS domain-containing protein [Candidatus Aenigmarchaeota archaeon]